MHKSNKQLGLNPRVISTGQLKLLLVFHLLPINVVVYNDTYLLLMGKLILKGASRLDAFSVYPFRT